MLPNPTREHGKLRYSPRDLAIVGLIRRLLGVGAGVEGIRMLKRFADNALAEEALRIFYHSKAFSEETGTDEEHYPHPKPQPPLGGSPGHEPPLPGVPLRRDRPGRQ